MAQHERDAISFWYRRVASSLVLANGAGVIAVGGFVSGKDDLVLAAVVAYPALTSFVTGAIASATSFVVSLLFSAFRMEAFGEFHTSMKEWSDRRSQKYPAYDWFSGAATVFLLVQLAILGTSALYFYIGSRAVISGLGDVACSKMRDLFYCTDALSPLYPISDISNSEHKIASLVTKPQDSSGRTLVNRNDATIVAEFFHSDIDSYSGYKIKIPSRYNVSVVGSSSLFLMFSEVGIRFNIVGAGRGKGECYLHVMDAYVGDGSPQLINPLFLKFAREVASGRGKYAKITAAFDYPAVTAEHYIGGKKGINFLKITPDGPLEDQSPVSTLYPNHAALLLRENGEAFVVLRRNSGSSCKALIKLLGFKYGEIS